MLGGMNMGVDQPGHGELARCIKCFNSIEPIVGVFITADPVNKIAFNRNGAFLNHSTRLIKTNDIYARDNKINNFFVVNRHAVVPLIGSIRI